MKVLVERISTSPNYAKALEWGKLATITGGAQGLVQAISLISGILVIRLLPTQEYSLYTLANTMLGTMAILADGGISTGVMAQGGKVWENREKLGVVVVTGLYLRKKFAIGSLLIAAPVLLYLLHYHGGSWLKSILIFVSLIPVFVTTLSGTLLEIPPKLKQDITPLQKNQVSANLGRLTMLALTLYTFPRAFIAIIAASLPQIWANRRLRKISAGYADFNQQPDQIVRHEILVSVKRILPYAIYYCVTSQTSIWLIAYFGSTTAIAQVGALGRIAMLLNIFTVVFNILITPRFVRLKNNSQILFKRYITIIICLFITCLLILTIVYVFPSQVLWILGKNYSNLRTELLLSVAASCIGLIAGISHTLYTSRGWAINPLIAIPVNVASTILGAIMLDVSSLQGVLVLSIVVESVQAIINVSYGAVKTARSSREL